MHFVSVLNDEHLYKVIGIVGMGTGGKRYKPHFAVVVTFAAVSDTIWVTVITYIRTWQGWLYLAVVRVLPTITGTLSSRL